MRPDFRWRGVGLNQLGRLAGWTFLMVVAGQLAGLVQSRVLSDAAEDYPGVLVTQNAWLLFMLPYSIIVLSIGTPYFTQLSEHAAAGRDDDVRGDVGRSIRTLGVFIVIATAALAAAAVPASRIFTDSRDEAVAAAGVLLCFLVSLVPLAVLFVIQRTFYAYNDTRTPFFFTLLQCALVVVTALAASTLPVEYLAAGIALGQSFASIVQVIVATWLLQRRLGGLRVGSWMLSLGRFALAAVPAAGAGLAHVPAARRRRRLDRLGQAARRGRRRDHRGRLARWSTAAFLALLRAPELGPALAIARDCSPAAADAARSRAHRHSAIRPPGGMPRGYHVLKHPELRKRGRTCVRSSSSDRVRPALRLRSTRRARTSSRSSSRARSRSAASS